MVDWSTEAGIPSEPAVQQSAAHEGEDYDWTDADWSFFDDLVAANTFKTFLVGRGVDVDSETREGLARLISAHQAGVRAVRAQVLIGRERRIRWAPWLTPSPPEVPVASAADAAAESRP